MGGHGTAVHGHQRLEAVAPVGGGGEPDPTAHRDLADCLFEGDGGDVVALIHDHQPVAGGELCDVVPAGEALDSSDVDDAPGPGASTAELADLLRGQVEVADEAGAPLLDERLAVDDDQRWHVVAGDEGTADEGLARAGRCHEHSEIVCRQGLGGGGLLGGQRGVELSVKRVWRGAPVDQTEVAAGVGDDGLGPVP